MRISDWSSDVCSSDLHSVEPAVAARRSWHHGARGDGRGSAQGALSTDAKGYRTAAGDDRAPAMGRKMGRRRPLDPGTRRYPRRTADRPGDDHRARRPCARLSRARSEEHTSELQSLMRISYAVFCLQTKTQHIMNNRHMLSQLTS